MERIGEYLVRRLVGEGGMGKVYEAEERLSKRRVALKVLKPELTRSEEGRRLFLNEMQILAHLEHPGLVRSLASFEDDGRLVMVLEYLSGRTLRQELTRRGALPWVVAVEHVVKIAEALAVAHEQEPSIVHRDLKPENVMLLAPEGAAEDAPPTGLKVMDFGVAKVLEGAHATNTQSVGTLQYMSPEQVDARPIDARSDLYALGLVFYAMLAGDPPFTSASPRELLNLQCTQAPPPLAPEVRRGLPRGVEDLLFALLEKEPKHRPSDARVVIERLAPFRAADDSGAAAPARTTRHPSRRHDAETKAPSAAEAEAPKTERTGAPSHPDKDKPAKEERPRTDTIALVEQGGPKRAARELPTWLALVAIVALSAVAGLATYVVRLRVLASHDAPAATATTTSTEAASARK